MAWRRGRSHAARKSRHHLRWCQDSWVRRPRPGPAAIAVNWSASTGLVVVFLLPAVLLSVSDRQNVARSRSPLSPGELPFDAGQQRRRSAPRRHPRRQFRTKAAPASTPYLQVHDGRPSYRSGNEPLSIARRHRRS